jgi:hypothetical protein
VTAISAGGVPTQGVTLAAGGGSWAGICDSAVKENIRDVDGAEILRQLAALRIAEWNYIAQDDSVRHLGPMAQDFRRAFGIGEDDRHITQVDADGVALAAIQELIRRIEMLEGELARLRARNGD